MWKFEHYATYIDEKTGQDITIKSYVYKEKIEGQAEVCAFCGNKRWPECCEHCVPYNNEMKED